MSQKDKYKQIFSEKNTYFSSLVSQKTYWTIEEILSISKDLLYDTPVFQTDGVRFSSKEEQAMRA